MKCTLINNGNVYENHTILALDLIAQNGGKVNKKNNRITGHLDQPSKCNPKEANINNIVRLWSSKLDYFKTQTKLISSSRAIWKEENE